ncbi:MAG: phytanoyl-CoA dioxygenase family protein [Gammaproteobacteria bacterium]|nr:phytanoyl-CoA dioxygenase family protein [Gammaproteobacteria bacterium]
MDIAAQGAQPHLDSLMQDLEKYDLLKHAVELDAYGLTVIPPEKMGVDKAWVTRLRDAILRTCEKRNDIEIGAPEDASPDDVKKSFLNSWYLLQEDEVFVEAALNPQVLTIARWLCGQSTVLAGHTWIIKPETKHGLGLHSDAHGIPPGGGHIAHVANLSWLCTDYASADDGPTVFVPGSHRYGRATLPHESKLDETPYPVVPLHGEAGSLAVWHGATWHGSHPRKNPGLRVTLVQVFMRMHMRPIHHWQREEISSNLLSKYPELERVLGLESLYPYKEHNQHPERVGPFMQTGTDPFA